MVKKPTQARQMSRQLENIRRKFERRAKAFEKAAKLTMNMGESAEYTRAAASLRQEAKEFTMATVRGHQEYLKTRQDALTTLSAAFGEIQAKAKTRLSYIPSQKPKDILRSESLANVQYKYAARDITVFTYGKVWHAKMTKEERQQAIKQEVATRLNIPIETVTTGQIMRYYEDAIRKFTGDESYTLADSPYQESFLPGRYAKELESGYAVYLRGGDYNQFAMQQIQSRYERKRK